MLEYVNVEPYKYTPTTVPAAEIPAPTPAPQAPAQSAPATQFLVLTSYVPTTTPAPESMQNVVLGTQQEPHIGKPMVCGSFYVGSSSGNSIIM